MKRNQSVSIIVRCKGRLDQLKNSLRSLLTQDYHWIEVIVVNYDCHEELHQWLLINCGQFINAGKLIEVSIKNQSYFDHSHSRNIGLHAARGDWVLFVGSEDVLDVGLVKHLVSRIGKMNNVFSVASRLVNEPVRKILFARRNDLLEVGGFQEMFKGYGYEHEDIIERLLLRGLECFSFDIKFIGKKLTHSDEHRYKHLKPPYNTGEKRHWAELSTLENMQRSKQFIKEFGIVANFGTTWGQGSHIHNANKRRWIESPNNESKRRLLLPTDTYAFMFDPQTGKLINEDELIKHGCNKAMIKRVKDHMTKKRSGVVTDSIIIEGGKDQVIDVSNLKPAYAEPLYLGKENGSDRKT